MGLETVTYIDDLVSTNPVGATDNVSDGDAHLRIIKAAILATFPNVAGAMTLTHTQLNDAALKSATATVSAAWTYSAAIANTVSALGEDSGYAAVAASPSVFLDGTGAAANKGRYGLSVETADLLLAAYNDANTEVGEILRVGQDTDGSILTANFVNGTLQYGGVEVGLEIIPQNSQSGNYTLLITDSGNDILHPSGGGAGDTYTIPANASVAYPIGTVLSFTNRDSNAVSIAITTDTMYLAGTTSTGTRTLAENGEAVAKKVETTVWIIAGPGLS